jgi:hypothetical protein
MKKVLVLGFFLLACAFVYGQVSKTITITIAPGIAGDVVDAYAWEFQYKETILDDDGNPIPNPETKAQFALRMFTEQAQGNIRSVYKSYKTHQGATEAAAQADADSLGITVQ